MVGSAILRPWRIPTEQSSASFPPDPASANETGRGANLRRRMEGEGMSAWVHDPAHIAAMLRAGIEYGQANGGRISWLAPAPVEEGD